jgi:hypothetical protein
MKKGRRPKIGSGLFVCALQMSRTRYFSPGLKSSAAALLGSRDPGADAPNI